MNNVGWYMALYYKYRQYPAKEINSQYKKSQLRAVYTNILNKVASSFNILHFHGSLNTKIKKQQVNLKIFKKDHLMKKTDQGIDLRQKNDCQKIYQDKQNDSKKYRRRDSSANNQNMELMLDLLASTGNQLMLLITHNIQAKKIEQSQCIINYEHENSKISSNKLSLDFQGSTQGLGGDDKKSLIDEQIIPQTNQEIKIYFINFCSKVVINTNTNDSNESRISFNIKSQKSSASILSQRSISSKALIKEVSKLLPEITDNNLIDKTKKIPIMLKSGQINNFHKEKQNQAIKKRGYDSKQQKTFENALFSIYYKQIPHDFEQYFMRYHGNQNTNKKLQLLLAESKSYFNLLIQTWLEFLFIKETPQTFYELITQIVGDEKETNFIQKISSYVYFITFMRTKKTLAKLLSKFNLLFLLSEIGNKNRSLKDIKLTERQGIIEVQDRLLGRNCYCQLGLNNFMKAVINIGRIISDQLSRNSSLFWGRALQQCFEVLNEYLTEKTSFIYSLLSLDEQLNDLNLQKKADNSIERIIKNLSQILQKQLIDESNLNLSTIKNITTKIPTVDLDDCLQNCKNMQENVLELKQWQKNILVQIQKFQAYNQLLDKGFRIFSHNAKFTSIFFSDSYNKLQNLKQISTIKLKPLSRLYCRNVEQKLSNTKYQTISDIDSTKQKNNSKQYSEFEQHCNYYHMTFKIFLKLKQKYQQIKYQQAQKTNIILPQEQNLNYISNHQKYQYQGCSNTKVFKPNIAENNIIKQYINKLIDTNQEEEEDNYLDQRLLTQINQHLSLVNICNLLLCETQKLFQIQVPKKPVAQESQKAYSMTQQTVLDLENSERSIFKKIDTSQLHSTESISKIPHYQEERINRSKLLPIITSIELASQIQTFQKQQIEAERRNAPCNFKRSISQSFNRRQNDIKNSYTNQGFVKKRPVQNSFEKNILAFDNNYEKIIEKVQKHNRCLNLLLLLFKKCLQYSKQYCKNIICAKCLKSLENCSDHSDSNTIQKNQLKQFNSQKDYFRQISLNKFVQWVRQYRQLFQKKNINTSQSQIEIQIYLAQQIETLSMKTEIIHVYSLISSFQVSSDTLKNIMEQHLVSKQKFEKIKVIGKKYYDTLHSMLNQQNKQQNILPKKNMGQSPSVLDHHQKVYSSNLLLIVVSTIQLVYNSSQLTDSDASAYINLLTQYFSAKTYVLTQIEKQKSSEELIDFGKIMEDVFDWNSQADKKQITQDEFINTLIKIRTNQTDEELLDKFYQIIEKQKLLLSKLPNEKTKIQFLQVKLFYVILREIYFHLYYDCSVFENKSKQAKKNYELYEKKMLDFFTEIEIKDLKEFKQKRKEQLKERSKFLQGHLANYQEEPICFEQERLYYIKIVCIFDKTLSLVTQGKRLQMQKRGSNSVAMKRKCSKDPIYMHYVSKQYVKSPGKSVIVFDLENHDFFQAIRIYDSMIQRKNTEGQRKYSIMGDQHFSITPIKPRLSCEEIKFIQQNKQSLLALWVNEEYCSQLERQISLTQKVFLLKIQKLYVDLDVRHKVFESFKDKILNYEMQKTKIYHQYMDYIRGLKLDVYSHVAGQDPIPYFKLIHAIKLYRLNIKQKEMEEKVHQQFGKNLGKWNLGILQDVQNFTERLQTQKQYWCNNKQKVAKKKKQLCEIKTIITKQLKRQQEKQSKQTKNSIVLKFSKSNTKIVTDNNESYKSIEGETKKWKGNKKIYVRKMSNLRYSQK